MIKQKTILICILIFGLSAALMAQSFWKGQTLSAAQVAEKWGQEPLVLTKFKAGDYPTKAKMAYSILTDKSLIGKTKKYIVDNFGSYDGFYFIDSYPAYIIQDEPKEVWQIVFKIDSDRRIRDIIVHKNCCEK